MQWPTHEVTNQVPDLQDYIIFSSDAVLMQGLEVYQQQVRCKLWPHLRHAQRRLRWRLATANTGTGFAWLRVFKSGCLA
jgi:hypothetical protein